MVSWIEVKQNLMRVNKSNFRYRGISIEPWLDKCVNGYVSSLQKHTYLQPIKESTTFKVDMIVILKALATLGGGMGNLFLGYPYSREFLLRIFF